ncbi:MAG: hypothetical protein RBU37_02960 [Myxococcota bacterium]|jgi:hypothetical protein|nr:hypothetical protein [Myxococcota bacterium]
MRVALIFFVLVLTALPDAVRAQVDDDGFAIVSDAQAQLNVEGIQAMKAQDWEKAIRLFRSALDLSELNVTYLNLGRALTRAGRCEEAVEVYAKVEGAPKVREPSPEVVKQKLGEYKLELGDLCPGKVRMSCEPPDMLVSLDGAKAGPCPTEVLSLPAGSHTVVGSLSGSEVTVQFVVAPIETADVRLKLGVDGQLALTCAPADMLIRIGEDAAMPCPKAPITLRAGTHRITGTSNNRSESIEVIIVANEKREARLEVKAQGISISKDPDKDPVIEVPPSSSSPLLSILGWTGVGLGAAALIGFAVVDLAVLAPLVDDMNAASDANDRLAFDAAREDFDGMVPVNYALLAVGSVLLVAGSTMVIIDAVSEREDSSLVLQPWVGTQAGGASLSWQF